MPWRVQKSDVDFFRADLWKDLRPYPYQAEEGMFAKDCFDQKQATIEASVIQILRDRIGSDAVPKPVRVEGSVLLMESIVGARLFDLIRHLKFWEQERSDGVAHAAFKRLMDRSVERLRLIQLTLSDVAGLYALEVYPMEQKLHGLLDLFVRVLDIREAPREWELSLEEFAEYWAVDCVSLPFRDATTKNMMVADPRLAISGLDDDVDGAQRTSVGLLLESEPVEYWDLVPVIDIDFTSVVHRTSPEDDPISLMCHEATYDYAEIRPEHYILDPTLGSPDPERTAASFLVRYLRFGGRKYAYKLINSQGFRVRFMYDDPLFYFRTLPGICRDLSPAFCDRFAPLLDLVEQIYDHGRTPAPSDVAITQIDHVRRYYPDAEYSYWQQNPLERERES